MAGSITVIVPTFNRAGYLAEALAALAAQTRPVLEILVWDDGSTDGTEAVARAAPEPIRYFRSSNGGKARALNAALEHASGDYVWICDDDDLARPDAAERLAGALDAAPEAGVAAGGYVRFSTDPATGARIYAGPGYWPDLSEGSPLRHLLEDIFLFQNATLVRREAYRRTGPFREDLARSIDYDMIVRLAARFPVVLIDATLFEQRKHDGPRGPLAARHAAERSDEVWAEFDRRIFTDFRKTLPLSIYEALYEAPDAVLARRAGLLQRACVYARRTDWDAALEDFEAAATTAAEVRLSAVERGICRRALAGKHGCLSALIPATRRRMARLSGDSDMPRALARGMVWRIKVALKAGRLAEAAAMTQFSLALLGRRPLSRRPGLAPVLRERRALPKEALLP